MCSCLVVCVCLGSPCGADPLWAPGNGHKATATNRGSATDVGCQGNSSLHTHTHARSCWMDCLSVSVRLSTLESVWKGQLCGPRSYSLGGVCASVCVHVCVRIRAHTSSLETRHVIQVRVEGLAGKNKSNFEPIHQHSPPGFVCDSIMSVCEGDTEHGRSHTRKWPLSQQEMRSAESCWEVKAQLHSSKGSDRREKTIWFF